MGFIQDKDKSIAPRNIVGLRGLFSGSRSSGSGGAIATDEVDYVRLSSGVNEPLAGLGTVDGVVTVAGDLVLCMAQTDPAFRGVYVASLTAWTRKVYISNPKIIIVEEGVTNGETAWLKVESETDSLDYVKVETGGGGGLPAGAVGNTMYHNGTDWVANDRFLYYDDFDYGKILRFKNTSSSNADIDIRASGWNPGMRISSNHDFDGYDESVLSKYSLTINSADNFRMSHCELDAGRLTIHSYIQYASYLNLDVEFGLRKKETGTDITQFQMTDSNLQVANLNNTGKQQNLLISASGSLQSTTYDRSRIDTAIPFSTTSLFEIMYLQPYFMGGVETIHDKTYSYKFKFKIFVTFSSIGGAGGFKLKCSASDGTHAGVFETPSLLKYSAVGAQVWIDDNYNAAVNYNNVQEFTALPTFNDRGMIVEGEVFLNDYAYDNVTFKIEVAQSVNTGTFEIGVGSYIDYEVCNTIND